ncbi:MAG: rhamnulokinase [Blastocatellia bacterium]|nr:rhamnulokinase [Blastocatellia bacterium]
MMEEMLFIAVDLGAGSGRVFLVGVAQDVFRLEEMRRFTYTPAKLDGHLRWNFTEIYDDVKAGIKVAGARAVALGKSIQSVGVDSWAVDYGLIDKYGALTEQPVCYRDARTDNVMDQLFAHVSKDKIFLSTGIQFLPFNTLYQIYAQRIEGIPKAALRLLLIPDLTNFYLAGQAVSEYTNATTTQLVNAQTKNWDPELLNATGLNPELFTEIVDAGTDLGELKDNLGQCAGLEGARVVATATHDTASAVAGAPLQNGWAYISSGTWSLVGIERESILINSEIQKQNFTNEGGAFGTIRFLKNVMGLWILEACRKEWAALGFDVDYESLLALDNGAGPSETLIYPDEPRLFNPPSMLDAIADQVTETGQAASTEPAAVTRMILDSLALRYASVLRMIESLTCQRIEGIQIVGGGSKNDYLNRATANASGLPVLAGPEEATVIGNVLVQAVAAGRFRSLAEARRHVSNNIPMKSFEPNKSEVWRNAAEQYAAIEAQYTGIE